VIHCIVLSFKIFSEKLVKVILCKFKNNGFLHISARGGGQKSKTLLGGRRLIAQFEYLLDYRIRGGLHPRFEPQFPLGDLDSRTEFPKRCAVRQARRIAEDR